MEFINTKRFEQEILRFIAIVGLLRMTYAIYINFISDNPLMFWMMDSVLAGVFLLLLITSYYVQRIKWLTIPFSIVLWIMVSVSFINTGGIYGMSEYNLLAIIIVMAMIHNGKMMQSFVLLILSTLILLTVSWEFGFSFLAWFDQIPTTGYMNYLIIVLLSTVALSYLVFKSGEEERRLNTNRTEMQLRIQEIEIENTRLERQKKELNRVNDWLESRINERSSELKKSNQSIEEFLDISVMEFRPSVQATVQDIADLKGKKLDDPFFELLGNSGEKLDSAFDAVKRKIKLYHSSKGRHD